MAVHEAVRHVHVAFARARPNVYLLPADRDGRWLSLQRPGLWHQTYFDPDRFDVHIGPPTPVMFDGVTYLVIYIQPESILYHGSPNPGRGSEVVARLRPAATSDDVLCRNNFFGTFAYASEYATHEGRTTGLVHSYKWRNTQKPIALIAIDECQNMRTLRDVLIQREGAKWARKYGGNWTVAQWNASICPLMPVEEHLSGVRRK